MRLIASLLAVVHFSQAGAAQWVYLESWNAQSFQWEVADDFPKPAGVDGSFELYGSFFYKIYTSNPTEGDIRLTLTGSSAVPTIIFGDYSGNPNNINPINITIGPACRDLNRFSLFSDANATIMGRIGRDVNYSIDAKNIRYFEIDGSLNRPLRHNPARAANASDFGPFSAYGTGADGHIQVYDADIIDVKSRGHIYGDIRIVGTGDVQRVRTEMTNHDIFGDISTEDGSIDEISTASTFGDLYGDVSANPTGSGNGLVKLDIGGVIGSPSSPSLIDSGGTTELIQAQAIYANINARAFSTSGVGVIRTLTTTTGGFVGSIGTYGLSHAGAAQGFSFAGDFEGEIVIDDAQDDTIEMPALTLGSLVQIDRALSDTWTLDADGLGGNIVADADFDGVGGWAGSGAATPGVFVIGTGSTQIVLDGDEPRYGRLGYTSEDLGGGAVGVVPFPFHELDCEPDHMSENTALPTEITIEFYGPIVEKDSASSTKPYIVDWADWTASDCGGTVDCSDTSCDESGVWTNVTNDWDYAMYPADTLHPGGNHRRIRLTAAGAGQFAFGQSISAFSVPLNVVYRVRFRPQGAANTLLCDVNASQTPYDRNSADEPVVDRPGAGGGKVWQCDEGNYKFFVGGVQTLTTLDMDADGVIGTSDVIEYGNTPSDVNRDGSIDADDLLLLIEAQGETVDG